MKNENNKLETISNLFEGKEIRSIWDAEKQEYYFSVIDVIGTLTDSNNPRNYWNMLKKRMTEEEKSELYTKCVQLKMKSRKGWKKLFNRYTGHKRNIKINRICSKSKSRAF